MPDLQTLPDGNISIINLFLAADWVVRSILGVLLALSVVSWTIIISRLIVIRRERQTTASIESVLHMVENIADLEQLANVNAGAASRTLQALCAEWQWSDRHRANDFSMLAERLRTTGRLNVQSETRRILGRTAMLASIGSLAPFIGLFGTVWGIMRSFIAIGQLEAVTIAVVAPGISEALFATAVGLFAAIPAVLAYNRIAQAGADLGMRWHTICEQIEVAISRFYSAGN